MIIDELKLRKNCEENGCNYRYFGYNAIVTTNMDTWELESVEVIESGNVVDKIKVKHINTIGNKKGKMQFHSQRYAYDLDYIFNNIIIPHEKYKKVYEKSFRIQELLAIHI